VPGSAFHNTTVVLNGNVTWTVSGAQRERERERLQAWRGIYRRGQTEPNRTDSQSVAINDSRITLASAASIPPSFVCHVAVPAQTGSRSTIKTWRSSAAAAAAARWYGASRLAAASLDHYAIRLAPGFYDALAAAQTLFITRSGDDVILFYAPQFSSWHPPRPARRRPSMRMVGVPAGLVSPSVAARSRSRI